MKKTMEIAVVVGIICFVLFLMAIVIPAQEKSDQNEIATWAKSNGYQVLSSERTVLDSGPFWLYDSKSQRIYRVVVQTGEGQRIIYFRFSLFSTDKEWLKR